jgi:hypothetical protein
MNNQPRLKAYPAAAIVGGNKIGPVPIKTFISVLKESIGLITTCSGILFTLLNN